MNAAIDLDWEGRFVDGQFPLLQWLGGSERTKVFLTELQGHPAQKAAVKLIPAEEEEAEVRLRDWALTTKLSHPSLLRVFQSGQCRINSRSMVYAVTEFSDEILSQILPERPLTPAEMRDMLIPILDALGYLHERGFVHGHLKPSNILAVDDRLKLSADSILIAGESPSSSAAPDPLAPSIYDAPELLAGSVSPAADLWSLGILIVEAFTQRPPDWDRATQKPPVVQKSIPQPFADIARECLQMAPERRCTLNGVRARLNSSRLSKPAADNPGIALSFNRGLALFLAAILVLIVVLVTMQRRVHTTEPTVPASQEQSEPVQPPAKKPPAAKPSPASSTAKRSLGTAASAGSGGVRQQVMPDVSARARESIRGTVTIKVRVTVDSAGNVTEATIDSSGGSPYFANLALKAAQAWKFKPAVGAWTLRFQFTQDGTTVEPEQVAL